MTAEHYTLMSADCHAGDDIDDSRPYLPSRLHAEFDAWKQDYINPFADLQDSKRVRNWDTAVRQPSVTALATTERPARRARAAACPRRRAAAGPIWPSGPRGLEE